MIRDVKFYEKPDIKSRKQTYSVSTEYELKAFLSSLKEIGVEKKTYCVKFI